MTRLSHIHLSHAWYRTDNQVKIGGENQKPQKWRNLQGQFGVDLHLQPSTLNLVWLIYLRFNAFKPSRWCEKLLRHEMGIFRTKWVCCREMGIVGRCHEKQKKWKGYFSEMGLLQRDEREYFAYTCVCCSHAERWEWGLWPKMGEKWVLKRGEKEDQNGRVGLLTGYVGLYLWL